MGGEGNGYFGDVPGYDRSKQREESLGHDVHALQTLAIDASKDSFGKDPAGDGGSSDLGDKGLRFFDSGDVQAVREAVSRYATFANAVLSADEQAVREGKQPQVSWPRDRLECRKRALVTFVQRIAAVGLSVDAVVDVVPDGAAWTFSPPPGRGEDEF